MSQMSHAGLRALLGEAAYATTLSADKIGAFLGQVAIGDSGLIEIERGFNRRPYFAITPVSGDQTTIRRRIAGYCGGLA
ncbi:MAG: hypothetical protein HQL38_07930 [Alphaproteobacteria bacterium]|nr:hypothetical protein [Alphaproteobacteria bacterium]